MRRVSLLALLAVCDAAQVVSISTQASKGVPRSATQLRFWSPSKALSNSNPATPSSTVRQCTRVHLPTLKAHEQAPAACLVLIAASIATSTVPAMLSGMLAACIIAPLAYAFDAATAQNASGKRRLEEALAHLAAQFFTDFKGFCGPEFFLGLLTMLGTFGTANLLSALGAAKPVGSCYFLYASSCPLGKRRSSAARPSWDGTTRPLAALRTREERPSPSRADHHGGGAVRSTQSPHSLHLRATESRHLASP